jgi:exopolyphosphatase / guanosine-5'-triphosphate,3'-diphosphate pyrophosphatase
MVLRMRVAVIDVGSSTVRLLVAVSDGCGVVPVRKERDYLFLGEGVERAGRLGGENVRRTARVAARYARLAREEGAAALELIVTAPGRQAADAGELLAALAAATGAPVRVLSPEEEGRLAFLGAVTGTPGLRESVAVCDVGGGSTEVVIGTASGGPAWERSLDAGAVRLTERVPLGDPPGKEGLAAAHAEVERLLGSFAPPLPQTALAAGGTARALRKIVGRELDREDFDAALAILSKRPTSRIAKTFGIHERRARTLPAGVVVLAAVQRRLGVPFVVSRAGLREGAVLELLDDAAAPAA